MVACEFADCGVRVAYGMCGLHPGPQRGQPSANNVVRQPADTHHDTWGGHAVVDGTGTPPGTTFVRPWN